MYTRGVILWLPSKASIPNEHQSAADLVEEGCFNHPVLVLSVNAAETAVVVLIITSFGGTDLSIRHACDTKARALYLPIYPSNAHPDNGMRLYLAGDQRLSKNSYIKIKPCRTIPTALLRPCKHGKFRLKTKSLQKLIKHMGFTDPWPKVVQVHQPVQAPQPVPSLPVAIHHPVREPISCASEYYIPGQWANDNRTVRASDGVPVHWVTSQNRPARVYSGRERTPLLLPTYIAGYEPKKDDSGSSWTTFAWVISIFTLVIGTAWYFKAVD